MSLVPRQIEDSVCTEIFRDMAELSWEGLGHSARSEQYGRWVTAPSVGERLSQYMPVERVRVWIKDGPVTEYPRARAGVGRFATLVEASSGPAVVVRLALGGDWEPVQGSLRVKPLRVQARSSGPDANDEVVVAWGPARDLKHLVWAALMATANDASERWHLVVCATFTQPVSAGERTLHVRIAERARLPLAHIELP